MLSPARKNKHRLCSSPHKHRWLAGKSPPPHHHLFSTTDTLPEESAALCQPHGKRPCVHGYLPSTSDAPVEGPTLFTKFKSSRSNQYSTSHRHLVPPRSIDQCFLDTKTLTDSHQLLITINYPVTYLHSYSHCLKNVAFQNFGPIPFGHQSKHLTF